MSLRYVSHNLILDGYSLSFCAVPVVGSRVIALLQKDCQL